MDQEKHKAAMNALSELIRSQLEGEERGRFASVKRLAVIGQKLMTEMSPRPEDVEDYFEGNDIVGAGNYDFPRPRQMGQIIGAGNDQQQMVREVMAMLSPAFSNIEKQNDAQRRASVARELNELLRARERLTDLAQAAVYQPGAIEKLTTRIETILFEMVREEKKEGDEDGLHMVPAVDVRRHQAGENGLVFDEANPDLVVPYGEGRRAGALPEGDEAWGAPNRVGHGG